VHSSTLFFTAARSCALDCSCSVKKVAGAVDAARMNVKREGSREGPTARERAIRNMVVLSWVSKWRPVMIHQSVSFANLEISESLLKKSLT